MCARAGAGGRCGLFSGEPRVKAYREQERNERNREHIMVERIVGCYKVITAYNQLPDYICKSPGQYQT